MHNVSPIAQSGNTFIYALLDPTTHLIKYIGKANDPQLRLYRHMREKGHSHKNSWLHGLKEKGLIPELIILEEVPVSQWQQREKYWITFYRSQGIDLVNGTDGGDGVHGMRHTSEARRKISEAGKGNQYGKGHKPTPQATMKRRASLQGHAVSSETREKIADSKRGKPRSPETRAKLSQALKGTTWSPNRKQRNWKPTEEFKAKRREFRHTPEAVEKIRIAARKTRSHGK